MSTTTLDYDALSFRNMVVFYQDELTALVDGSPIEEAMTPGDRRLLMRKGLLELFPAGRWKWRYQPTERAQAVLKGTQVTANA
jgi:hypothetical protein